MKLHDEKVQRRSARHRGANFVVAPAAFLLLTLVVSALGLVSAMGVPIASATNLPHSASATSPPLEPVVITSPINDTLFASSAVTISGTKDPAGRVEVQSLTGGQPYCTVPSTETSETRWSCTFNAPNGRNTITIFQYSKNPQQPPLQSRVTVRALDAPTIDGTSPIVTTGLITGTGFPGSGIVLAGSAASECPGIVQPNGFWSCPLSVDSSGEYRISARQTWNDDDSQPGGASAVVTVQVDREPPAVPTFSQPVPGAQLGSQSTAFSGAGEENSRVEVFVDGTLSCSDEVSAQRWSCVASIPEGQHTVQGIQWDTAGNPSGASSGIPIRVSKSAAVPPPAESRNTPLARTPTATPEPTVVPSPSPSPRVAAAPSPIQPLLPPLPPPVGGTSSLPPLETWDTPTDYGAGITAAGSTTAFTWLWGTIVGAGFILLIAVPLRLLFSALRERFPRHYFARDHSRLNNSEKPLLRPRTIFIGTLGAAVALAALAGGIQAEVRYLRLVMALGLALVLLNVLAVAVTGAVMSRRLGSPARFRLVPFFLAIAALTALFSRSGGIQPPFIVGVVMTAAFASQVADRSRGIVALGQLVVTVALGVGAWLAHSMIGPVDGFLPSLLSESLAGLCIAALGSAVVLALPVSGMPGRLIFEWSRTAWAVLAFVAATMTGVIIIGGAKFPVPLLIGVTLASATLCLALWAWIRMVRPALRVRSAKHI
ncbi:MAG: hypothetical protein ACRCSP_07135 [Rhodoglobus sp.]